VISLQFAFTSDALLLAISSVVPSEAFMHVLSIALVDVSLALQSPLVSLPLAPSHVTSI